MLFLGCFKFLVFFFLTLSNCSFIHLFIYSFIHLFIYFMTVSDCLFFFRILFFIFYRNEAPGLGTTVKGEEHRTLFPKGKMCRFKLVQIEQQLR